MTAASSQDRARRRKIFARLKERWRNAPPHPAGIKPTSDLWHDLQARDHQTGRDTITEDDFWKLIVRSVREKFFDADHELFSIVDGKIRITSGFLRETLQWDLDNEDWPLLRALVRDSWAPIRDLR
jgi:hypothetical protein